MDASVSALKEAPARSRHRRKRWIWIVVGVVVGVAALFALVTGLGMIIYHAQEGRPVPTFASLAEHPDASLQGTVAYTAGPSRCVRIVAAAGQPSKDVVCLGPLRLDPAKAATQGKEMPSPQLVWRSDGRLEITGFGELVGPETKGKRPAITALWQKVADVRTGKVEDVPATQLPSGPNRTTRPTVSPSGQRITEKSDPSTGRVAVMLTDATGTRTVMSAHGPGEYAYGVDSAFWAPNWQWIAADDGRVLVITPTEPAVTRVLVDAGGGGEWPTFAITATDILTTSR